MTGFAGIPITLTPAGGAPATVTSAGIAVTIVDVNGQPAAVLPAGNAPVANNATVAVLNSAGADSHPATAHVSASVLTNVQLNGSAIIVDNGDTNLLVANSSLSRSSASVVDLASIPGTPIATMAATSALALNSDGVNIIDGTNVANGTATATLAVSAGSITQGNLLGTVKIVKSGVKYTCPAPTGTFVNGITITLVGSAITAVVLS
jgi:hypothetical protein